MLLEAAGQAPLPIGPRERVPERPSGTSGWNRPYRRIRARSLPRLARYRPFVPGPSLSCLFARSVPSPRSPLAAASLAARFLQSLCVSFVACAPLLFSLAPPVSPVLRVGCSSLALSPGSARPSW